MHNAEAPKFDEFDLITAELEVEMVMAELALFDVIIRDYPKLASMFEDMKLKVLENPTAHFVYSAETQIMTERNLPELAKVIYDVDGTY